MSSYLGIAETVLLEQRRPLSSRAILRLAFAAGHVPHHLYGQTQHKTLQARLSEDILYRGDRSPFFRTEPGKFFLRRFIYDESIPSKYRQEMTAPRRRRSLFKGAALSIDCSSAAQLQETKELNFNLLRRVLLDGGAKYVRSFKRSNDALIVLGCAVVVRDGLLLSYRSGSYRSINDSDVKKRTVSFSTLVSHLDPDLFSFDEFGIVDASVRAALLDLGFQGASYAPAHKDFKVADVFPLRHDFSGRRAIVVVVKVNAPSWFEPWRRRLSISEFRWINPDVPENDPEAFDSLSRKVIEQYHEALH